MWIGSVSLPSIEVARLKAFGSPGVQQEGLVQCDIQFPYLELAKQELGVLFVSQTCIASFI